VRKVGGTIFCYDKNGNMVKRGGSSIAYTSYNLPTVINSGSNSSTLSYGAFRNRFKQVTATSAGTETTLYMAGLFERVTRPDSTVEYRHRILGGDGVAAIHTRISGIGTTYYLRSDHLGSPELVTNSAGAEVLRLSFTAYGARRNPATWSGAPPAADLTKIADITRAGFTGHEMLDSVGLVHMNGRVYEPAVGRFLSADPIVDGAFSSQGINAYAYVRNNPLRFIDPSGFECVLIDGVFEGCFGNIPVNSPRWPDSGLGYDGYAGPIFDPLPPHNNRGAKINRQLRGTIEPERKEPAGRCANNWIWFGNMAAELSNWAADVSSSVIVLGGVMMVSGLAGDDGSAFGIALIGFGGILGTGSGLLQISAGGMQWMGGAENSNIGRGLFNLTPGFVAARGLKLAIPKGGRSAIERKVDDALRKSTTVAGGTYDLFAEMFSTGATKVSCR
jgi:RHS repeat-associated protein